MITITDINRFNNTLEIYGLSTDAKPVEQVEFKGTTYAITDGSIFYEKDTTTLFMYDEENHQWLEQ